MDAYEAAHRQSKADLQKNIVDRLTALPSPTAKTMAEAAFEVVKQACLDAGMDPSYECMFKTPEESGDFMGGTPGIYIVGWESGPYMWAIGTTHAITMGAGRLCETHFGFDLQFYPAEDY